MVKKLLSKIVDRILYLGFQYDGYIDYPGVGIIRDTDVYSLILNHSRIIDRLNPIRMTEMSLLGQCILMGIFEGIDPNDFSWKFYGKHSLKERGL